MRDYSTYELIQFKEKGKIFTYLPDYPRSWYEGMDISAIFKVKLKDNRTWFQKTFLKRKWLKYWYRHLISSQINKLKTPKVVNTDPWKPYLVNNDY